MSNSRKNKCRATLPDVLYTTEREICETGKTITVDITITVSEGIMPVNIHITMPEGPLQECLLFVAEELKRRAAEKGVPLNRIVQKGEPYFLTRFMGFNPKTRRVMYRIHKVAGIGGPSARRTNANAGGDTDSSGNT